jgi:Ca-activated chloride channel family protein
MKTILRSLSLSLVAAAIFIGCASQQETQVKHVPEEEVQNTRQIEQPPSPEMAATLGLADYAQSVTGKRGALARTGFQGPDWNTEDYALIEENGFQTVTDHSLSTISIDVDAASYSNIRRFIRDGQLPPKDAVRIEEMINYFTYDYPEPEGDHPFSTILEVGRAPWNANHQLLHVGLKGESIDLVGRPASNLVFLLDVSGSMNSPDKLPLLKKAFRMLVSELGEGDRVSIVVYAGAAGRVLDPTPGDQNEAILEALNRLQAGGSTAGSAGIQLAYQTAGENFIPGGINRVILATDGDFNVGASSDAELVRMIESRREEGTFLTVLGFGTGNLKDNKMEQIADHGNGNYYYIDNELEARKVLVSELGGTLHTIAKDVKIQIEFNPAMVQSYRLIGYENRLLAAEDFNDDKKDAGDLGAGHTVTALYEIVPAGASSAVGGSIDDLRYQSTTTTAAAGSGEMLTLKLRYKEPDGDTSQLIAHTLTPDESAATSGDFAFSAAVASFGMILRNSEHMGASNLAHVLKLARLGKGQDRMGYRADFVGLVEDYRRVTESRSGPADD